MDQFARNFQHLLEEQTYFATH